MVLVAYDYGVPVVATSSGALGEQVIDGETGYLVEPQNVEALFLAMEKFVVEPNVFNVFEKGIKEYMKDVSWNNSAKKLMEMVTVQLD